MSPFLIGMAAIVIAAAVVAVTIDDPRATTLGLAIAFGASALVADPLPSLAAIGARFVAAALGGWLLWMTIRGATGHVVASPVGPVAVALAAIAAAVVGAGTILIGGTSLGPAAAEGAGFALIAVSVAPIASGQAVRSGVGLGLLLAAVGLVAVGLGGTPTDLDQLMACAITVSFGVGLAVVIQAGPMALEAGPVRDAAHPIAPAPETQLPPEARRPNRGNA